MVDDFGAELLGQPGRHLIEPALIEIGQHQFGAIARQPFGERNPDALCGAGDDGDIVFEFLVHCGHFFRG
jgi:hypothetical protein